MNRSLQDKATDIKGKQYVEVHHRVRYFVDNYKNAHITTDLLSEPTSELIVIKATAHWQNEDGEWLVSTGHAQERVGEGYINKTSAMENAETSAVGRALAMMDIGVIDSIASVDEINKAKNRDASGEQKKAPVKQTANDLDL